MDRITMAHLKARVESLNTAMEKRNSKWRYGISFSYESYNLDRLRMPEGEHFDTVICGTKRELATYVGMIARGIYDSEDKV